MNRWIIGGTLIVFMGALLIINYQFHRNLPSAPSNIQASDTHVEPNSGNLLILPIRNTPLGGPDGFRGAKWGDSLNAVQGKEKVKLRPAIVEDYVEEAFRPEGIKFSYWVDEDTPTLDNIELDKISYYFANDQLYKVEAFCKATNGIELLRSAERYFGLPTKVEKGVLGGITHYWSGDIGTIEIDCDNSRGMLTIYDTKRYKYIVNEAIKNPKKKNDGW